MGMKNIKTGYDKTTNAFILRQSKKLSIVNRLGGKCNICSNSDFTVLDFHHVGEKNKGIADIFNHRISEIVRESEGCILLCANCHQQNHKSKKDTKYTKNKRFYLEIKGIECCERCGYKDYIGSLNFHHIDPMKKNFNFGRIFTTRILEMKEQIENELNNCQVLCRNCHRKEHFDIDRFEKFKEEIIQKSKEYIESRRYNHEEVIEKWKMGRSMYSLHKEYNCSKSVIKYIIDKYKRSVN